MLSLLKNNPLSPIFRCEELKKKVVVEIKTGKKTSIRLLTKSCWLPNKIWIKIEMIRRKSLTWRAAAAAKEDAAVTDVKNLENELGLCE